MRKTEQYHLNQWDLGDQIRMEDFNNDNLAIEAALASLSGAGGGISVLYSDYGNPTKSLVEKSYNLTTFIKDWSSLAFAGILIDIPSADYNASTDSFHISFITTSEYNPDYTVKLPKPGTFLLLFTPFYRADRPAGGFLFAEDFVRPFRMDKTFAQLQLFQYDYRSSSQQPHSFHVAREIIFGVK